MKTKLRIILKIRIVFYLSTILLLSTCKDDSSLPIEVAEFSYNRCTINYAKIVANTHTEYITSSGVSKIIDGTHSFKEFNITFEGSVENNVFSNSFIKDDRLGNNHKYTLNIELNSTKDEIVSFSFVDLETKKSTDNFIKTGTNSMTLIVEKMQKSSSLNWGNNERVYFEVNDGNTCDHITSLNYVVNEKIETRSSGFWGKYNIGTTGWKCKSHSGIKIFFWKSRIN